MSWLFSLIKWAIIIKTSSSNIMTPKKKKNSRIPILKYGSIFG